MPKTKYSKIPRQPKKKEQAEEQEKKNPRKAWKFRLYPTEKQIGKLEWTLKRCCELYNASLQERRDAYKMYHVSVNYTMQQNQLPELKEIREEYQDIHSQVLQDVLYRVDKAFKAFFKRVQEGQIPGYPRFKGSDRYDSFTYPQSGYEIIGKKLSLSKIGHIRIKLNREMKGIVKTCTIKREGHQWYAIFVTELAPSTKLVYHPSGEEIGVDLGLLRFATLSNGEQIENPRYGRRAVEKLAKVQQKLARCKLRSHRRTRAKQRVSSCYRKVRNQRRNFHNHEARKLVNTYGVIIFEDLSVKNMMTRPKPKKDEKTGQYLPNGAAAKSGLNKSIQDAGWSTFVSICRSKAEEAGATVVLVAPKDTSQMCSFCELEVPKDLDERWHSCPHCGLEADRDHNAAINVLKKYFLSEHLSGARSSSLVDARNKELREEKPSGSGSGPQGTRPCKSSRRKPWGTLTQDSK